MIHAEEKWKDLLIDKLEKIRTELSIPKEHPCFTVSCGIAHGSKAKDTASLVRMADEALYRTKKNGRDGYTFAD
jgi:PleD family two-component response regulator